MRPGGFDGRAICLGVEPSRAATLRVRDRVFAAIIATVATVVLGFVFGAWAIGPDPYAGAALFMMVIFGPLIWSFFLVPTAIAILCPCKRSGWIGLAQFLGLGAVVGAVGLSGLYGNEAFIVGLIGGGIAGIATWLCLFLLRFDLFRRGAGLVASAGVGERHGA